MCCYIYTYLAEKNDQQVSKLAKLQQTYIFMQWGFSLSNWQKVQFNTDLFSDMQKCLYTEEWLD